MDTNLRDSGIDIIGKVSIGTHIAHMFSSKDDFFHVCVPYIKAGLQNNELCLWIYSQYTNYEEVTYNLSKYIEDLDKYLKSEQLIIIPYTKWYIENNDFNEVRVNRLWNMCQRDGGSVTFVKKGVVDHCYLCVKGTGVVSHLLKKASLTIVTK
jgi:hypothetical protein